MDAVLRPWRPDDATALVEIYAHADDALLSNIPDDRSTDGARSWIETVTAAEAEGNVCTSAIVDDADGSDHRILGNVMASGIEHRHSTAWISYWAVAAARGRGVTSAGLRSLVDHLHDAVGIYRLELGCRVNNPASAAVSKERRIPRRGPRTAEAAL